MRTIRKLYAINVLKPKGLWHLIVGMGKHGKTMMTMLYFTSKYYPSRTAISSKSGAINYLELFQLSMGQAHYLANTYQLKRWRDNLGKNINKYYYADGKNGITFNNS